MGEEGKSTSQGLSLKWQIGANKTVPGLEGLHPRQKV